MNRRRFVLASGSAILSSSVTTFKRPTVGLEFKISSIESANPSNVDSVLVNFQKMDIVTQYLDDSKLLSVDIQLDIGDNWTNSKTINRLSFSNGDKIDLTKERGFGQIEVQVGTLSTSVARGQVTITINHEQISESYSQSFNITNTQVTVDSYEDGDITHYQGDTGTYSVKTDRSFSGSSALYNGGNNDSIFSFSGLGNYPQPGDKIRLRVYHGDDEAGSSLGFGFEDSNNGYRAGYHAGQNYWVIYQYDSGSANDVATVNDSTPKSGQWWEWIIDWRLNGKIVFTVLEENGSEIAKVEHNSTDYSGDGISFTTAHQSGNHDHWWDDLTIE